jgi:hypothetical protein
MTAQSPNKRKKYVCLSPDGFTIEPTPHYTSLKKANEAFENFAKRYQVQGYYSSARYGRIELPELENYCKFITI